MPSILVLRDVELEAFYIGSNSRVKSRKDLSEVSRTAVLNVTEYLMDPLITSVVSADEEDEITVSLAIYLISTQLLNTTKIAIKCIIQGK